MKGKMKLNYKRIKQISVYIPKNKTKKLQTKIKQNKKQNKSKNKLYVYLKYAQHKKILNKKKKKKDAKW